MDEGEIIPDVALGNSSYRITRKREANLFSSLLNHPKCSASVPNEPDGPLHKKTHEIVDMNKVIVIDDDFPEEPLKPKHRNSIEMEDVFYLNGIEKVPETLRKTTSYYSAQSSPEKKETKSPQKLPGKENPRSDHHAHSEKEEELLERALVQTSSYKIEPDLNRQFPNDHVFFAVSSLNDESPPTPYPSKAENHSLNFSKTGFLKLPWSCENMDGRVRRYVQVLRSLQSIEEKIISIDTFIIAVREYANITDFGGLIRFHDTLPTADEKKGLLKIISGIAKLALRAEYVINKPIPFLTLEFEQKTSSKCSISLSQEQCACLLANAFFCTFPDENEKFGYINMDGLFSSDRGISKQKLPFILAYFDHVLNKMPVGVVTFRRVSMKAPPLFRNCKKPVPLMKFGPGKIEDYPGALQVDFANRFIGGGVLGHGSVQEEIMFLTRPEMMVAMMLAPRMNNHEAIFIAGAQKYSSYSGYAYSMKWVPLSPSTIWRDKFKRVAHEIVAIDAKNVSKNPSLQYDITMIDRELTKCYAGFHTDQRPPFVKPIATGNWGCGVFGGNLQLKALIQLIAAGAAERELIYVAFSEEEFKSEFSKFYRILVEKKVEIGELYCIISTYDKSNSTLSVFDYVLENLK